jgi:hypothetical protein
MVLQLNSEFIASIGSAAKAGAANRNKSKISTKTSAKTIRRANKHRKHFNIFLF